MRTVAFAPSGRRRGSEAGGVLAPLASPASASPGLAPSPGLASPLLLSAGELAAAEAWPAGGSAARERAPAGRGSRWRYYDAEGANPFRRFLRPDNPSVLYPTRRIVMMMFLGSCLSTVGVQLSADEYYEGPQQSVVQFHRENGTGFPVHIAFNDVGCSIAGFEQPVLSNITGQIRPGRLTGIMGQSGSGKTTFAYSLLGRGKRYCSAGAPGTVYLNGRPRDLEAFLDRVGFVPQDDVLYADLTVEEALTFSASWRLPRDMTPAEKSRVVEDAIETLDLRGVRNRRIGSPQQRSISGGERKRASIGMELVSQPAVLVMDEATSGLDSSGTFQLMSMLRRVAKRGVSVVTVIHQPSARVFNLLDDLILMQNGEAAYVGSREDVVPFLAFAGYDVPTAGAGAIPSAEFILDVLAGLELPSRPATELRERLCHSTTVSPQRGSSPSVVGNAGAGADPAEPEPEPTTGGGWCVSRSDGLRHPFLPVVFRHQLERTGAWASIERAMRKERDSEDVLRCVAGRAEQAQAQRLSLQSQLQQQQQQQATQPELEDRVARSRLVAKWHNECAAAMAHEEQKGGKPGRDQNGPDTNDGSEAVHGLWDALLDLVGVQPCRYEGESRVLCLLVSSARKPSTYHQLPKPGLKRQVHLWFWQIMGLKYRRGLTPEVSVIVSLAAVVSFVRSFNGTWNRRAVSNLFLSLSIGLLGMIGAVFKDEIAPVQRAASAGMLLGAHEFAVLAESIVWGWCVCHIYSLVFFICLWMRTGVWIAELPDAHHHHSHQHQHGGGCSSSNSGNSSGSSSGSGGPEDAGHAAHAVSPLDLSYWVRLQKYYEFAHMLHLNYLASQALGSAICVFANHDQSVSYVVAVATLITCHVFAFFTPNQNQIRREATIFSGAINVGPAVEVLCSLSYVRYFLEGIFLWDPSPADRNGRSYVLRYFGYVDNNKTHCATSLFSLWTFAQAIRFVVFGFRNSNDFHSLHDTPLFFIFIFKVLSCHVVALLIMTMIQEWYFPFVAAMLDKSREAGEEEITVDILSVGQEGRATPRGFHHGFKND